MRNEVSMIEFKKIMFGSKRLRKEYNHIRELKGDILEAGGLIHSLCVLPTESGHYTLVAGGRRYVALKELFAEGKLADIYPDGKVPATFVSEGVTRTDLVVIELMENLSRSDMTPFEIAKGRTEIHEMLVRRAEKDGENWSVRDTAKRVGVTHKVIYDDVKLVQAAEIDPAITRAKTRKEMQNRETNVKKAVSAVVASAVQEQEEEKGEVLPVVQLLTDSYNVDNTLEWITKQEDESFDMVELDTPFAINLNEEKAADADSKATYDEWTPEEYKKNIPYLVRQAERILKPNGWVVFWFAPDPWWDFVRRTFATTDLKGRMQPAIWLKATGQSQSPKYNMGSCFEYYVYFRKGSMELNLPGRQNYHAFKPITSGKKVHLTEKPVELYEDVIKSFVPKGKRICSPFLGSGNIILAGFNRQSEVVGCDGSEEHKKYFIEKVRNQFIK